MVQPKLLCDIWTQCWRRSPAARAQWHFEKNAKMLDFLGMNLFESSPTDRDDQPPVLRSANLDGNKMI